MAISEKITFPRASLKSARQSAHQLFWSWLIFLIIGLLGILSHAMWRDELNGWLIARDSESLGQFFYNIRYEGHPFIWYSCLSLLNKITDNPVIMQLFHWLLAVTSVTIFLRFSPFTKLQKILFIFGYLPLYEYQVISRNYVIGMLTLFLACWLWETRKKTYIGLSLILALMANTNAYCLLISFTFALTLGFEKLFSQPLHLKLFQKKRDILGSIFIYLGGVAVSIITLLPPSDSTLQGGASQWFLQLDFYRFCQSLSRIWNSYILILVPSDSKLFDGVLFAILSLLLLLFVATLLIRKPVALFFYLSGSFSLLLFTYLKFLGSARHYGHLYLVLIVALWLASYYPKSSLISQKVKIPWHSFVNTYRKTFLLIILVSQVIAGLVAFSRDVSIPYSASREVAHFIQQQQLDKLFIVGSEDFTIAPISGYLNKKVYYPESQTVGSYVLFNHNRKEVDDQQILQEIQSILRYPNESLLLILNHELTTTNPQLEIQPIQQFTKAFIYNEKYYLYQVTQSQA